MDGRTDKIGAPDVWKAQFVTRHPGRRPSSLARLALVPGLLLLLVAPAAGEEPAAPLERLLRERTQALLDAVGAGDVEIWDSYLDPRAIYVMETGEVLTKSEVLAEIRPLPDGLDGELRIGSFTLEVHGDTAVATHEDRERLDYFGQRIESRYRTTHTWRRSDDDWRVIAVQVLAIPEDPPAREVAPDALAEYGGVYRLTPEITYTIRRDGRRLVGQRTGREEQELHLEATDVLFVKGQPRSRKVMLRDKHGRIVGFADRREGHDIVWRRMNTNGE